LRPSIPIAIDVYPASVVQREIHEFVRALPADHPIIFVS
jgi:hypothetical protein